MFSFRKFEFKKIEVLALTPARDRIYDSTVGLPSVMTQTCNRSDRIGSGALFDKEALKHRSCARKINNMSDNNDHDLAPSNNGAIPHESDPIAEGKSVLIKNLKFETSPSRVRKIFEKFGAVRDVYIPLDYFTKRPRGFAFVEFFSGWI